MSSVLLLNHRRRSLSLLFASPISPSLLFLSLSLLSLISLSSLSSLSLVSLFSLSSLSSLSTFLIRVFHVCLCRVLGLRLGLSSSLYATSFLYLSPLSLLYLFSISSLSQLYLSVLFYLCSLPIGHVGPRARLLCILISRLEPTLSGLSISISICAHPSLLTQTD